MTWTFEEREYFFGRSDSADLADADAHFLNQYCSHRTREQIQREMARDGTEILSVAGIRRVLDRIASLVPSADHTSPGWSYSPPLVVMGRAELRLGRRPQAVLSGNRFGLCIHEGRLFLWVSASPESDEGGLWVRWRKNYWRYDHPLALCSQEPAAAFDPLAGGSLVELLRGIEREFNERDAPKRSALLEVLRTCRAELDGHAEWNIVYPALATAVGSDYEQAPNGGDGGDGTAAVTDQPAYSHVSPSEQDQTGKPRVQRQGSKTTVVGTSVGSSVFGAGCDSMLEVLRQVAIARVRTVLPNFGDDGLDRWIMSSGYPGLALPHADTGDLVGTYAASLTNAGGAKPAPVHFGAMVGQAFGEMLVGDVGSRSMNCCFADRSTLARACAQTAEVGRLGGAFGDDIRAVADGAGGRKLICGLLDSVLAFARWCIETYDGSATRLHEDFMIEVLRGDVPTSQVLAWIRTLQRFRWLGVATSANFVKDSQSSGLRLMNPRTAASVLAGWFVKPDLHVTRLMALITGRYPARDFGLASLGLLPAMTFFRESPDQDFGQAPGYPLRATEAEIVIVDVHSWASTVGTSPLEIDRVLYLIGARSTMVEGIAVQEPWYDSAIMSVTAAIERGVRRKS